MRFPPIYDVSGLGPHSTQSGHWQLWVEPCSKPAGWYFSESELGEREEAFELANLWPVLCGFLDLRGRNDDTELSHPSGRAAIADEKMAAVHLRATVSKA